MERDPSNILYSVVLMRLTDEASREGVAGALSRLSGLPVERISQRLDRLPWTMIRGASRPKVVRLVNFLERLNVEIDVIPPLPDAESPGLQESAGKQQLKEGVDEGTALPYRHSIPPASIEAEQHGASTPVQTPAVAAVPPWHKIAEQSPPPPTQDARESAHAGMEPVALEGVLDPAFRLERPDSWLRAIVVIPWNVLAGTLQALASTLDRAFGICRAHLWQLFAIVGIPWMIIAGIAVVGAVIVAATGLTLKSLLQLPAWLMVIGVLVAIPGGIVLGALFLFWPQAALVHAISEIYLGREISVDGAYRFAWTRIVRFVLTSYMMMLITSGLFIASCLTAGLAFLPLMVVLVLLEESKSPIGIVVVAIITSMAFVVPFAYCLPRLLLYDKVLMIEDSAYGEAFRRSWRLTSGRAAGAWYTGYYWLFGMLLLVLIPLHWGIMGLFEGPALILAHVLPVPKVFGTYAGQVVSTFGSLLAQVYAGAVNVLFYYCIRSSKEGHDLLALVHMDEENKMQ